MKLAIGTANLDIKYGIRRLRIKKDEIHQIFKFVKKNNIKLIDTATIYGNSEKIIGSQKLKGKKIVTKIFLKNKEYTKEDILSIFKLNLKRLKRKRIYALLIHNIYDLKINNRIILYDSLKFLKEKKYLKKIGFSIYSIEDLRLFKNFFKPDILQIPINIFDRRFENKLFQKYIIKNKIEIHSRSCFLQGLLICYENNNIKFKKFKKWRSLFRKFDYFCQKHSISRFEACILYLKKNKFIKYAIFGFEDVKQLKMIYSVFNKKTKNINFPKYLSSKDCRLIDPRKW
tara:strand:+ start:1701 stop:2558 length:858 start_codon:yes stop_codon:yes gene_type:complete